MSELTPAEVVGTVLADIAFAAPVDVEDCKAVHDVIKAMLPKAVAEVYFHTGKAGDDVVIRVDSITRRVTVS